MFRWLAGRGAREREVQRMLARMDNALWESVVHRHPFLVGLSSEERELLRHRSAWMLASKQFSGVQGLVVTDEVAMTVAVQAALPILYLDPVVYEGWTEIILYPGGFLIPTTEVDEAGVVHEYVQEASGEAWEGGPVCLSWEDAGAQQDRIVNVVIHEFAHKLDLHAGDANGVPSLGAHRDIAPAKWRRVLHASFHEFEHAVAAAEDAVPVDVDPDSPEGHHWFEHLPLDPYAATDLAEFFAVSSEAFFVTPRPLAHAMPDWYGLLRAYYRQDPLRRLSHAG